MVRNAKRTGFPDAPYNFPDAIKDVLGGAHVTRMAWGDVKTFIIMADGFLCIHKSDEDDGVLHALMISEGDLTAEDWIVC
jgi:hypothetical protein